MTTPRKFKEKVCIVCKDTDVPKPAYRWINTDAGKKKNLAGLLYKYGEIRIDDGGICRKCEKKLLIIDRNVTEFRDTCQRGLNSVSKRCLSDIPDEDIENVLIDKSSKGQGQSAGVKKRENFKSIELDLSLNATVNENSVLFTPARNKLNDVSNVSSVCSDSGYFSSVNFTPILPKPGCISSSTPVSVLHENGQCSKKLSYIDDHSYAINPEKPAIKKVQGDKVKENTKNESEAVQKLKSLYFKDSEQDFISDSEFASILSVLPLRSRKDLASCLLNLESFGDIIKDLVVSDLSKHYDILANRKNGKVSVLMTKDYEELKDFNWDEVVVELVEEFPLLAKTLLSFLCPDKNSQQKTSENISTNLPRIGLLYAVLAQGRNRELSRVQRLVDVILLDNLCDQKVFDRLNPLGVCLSYSQTLRLVDKFAGHYNSEVIDALRAGKTIRIVGDNINWKTGVHDERKDNHATWHHAFGSAVIVQNVKFNHLCDMKPQIHVGQLTPETFLPTADDWRLIREDYGVLMFHVAQKHIPYFQQFSDVVPNQLIGKLTDQLTEKNKVIPLPVLHLNEQKYEDVVKIMDFYEQFLDECYQAAGLPTTSVHIGGDQLTRERFSGAKRLRSGGTTPSERFDHLSPITFELFHMLMNYVSLMFKRLYNEDSSTEIGTMKCEANRILRTSVNPNVNDHYDADKDFIVSFTDAYIIEAVMKFFEMDGIHSAPKNHVPPEVFESLESKESWVAQKFGKLVDSYVWNKEKASETLEEDGVVIPVVLANGTRKTILVKKKPQNLTDGVKNYAHLVLELGLNFKAMLSLCKLPDRDRGLRILKSSMVHFKANNNLSKYALEIMRFLVHQYHVLSEKEAHEEFYGLFVNTKGHKDTHIPCDLQMEYIVKEVKKNVKHMFSNKTESNITTRTSALPAIQAISQNFDRKTNVVIRCKKHSDMNAISDELDMIQDLRKLNPFEFKSGRFHQSFKNVPSTMEKHLDIEHFRNWIVTQKHKFSTELGN